MKTAATHRPGRPVDEALWARRRDEILDAAAMLFADRGYSDTTTEMLADKLAVGKGTIYRYFPTKRDLFLGACDRLMHRLFATIEESASAVEDPLDKISTAIRTYLRYFVEHPEFAELMIQERAQFKDRKTPTYFAHREARIEQHRQFFRELIASGRVRNIPVDSMNGVLSNLVYGTMFANYLSGQRRSEADQAQEILDVVFFGILSESERDRRKSDLETAHGNRERHQGE